MDATKYLSSDFLKTEDLQDDTTVTISEVAEEEIKRDGAVDTKLVVRFDEFGKGLVLNNVNNRMLIKIFGNDTDSWLGKKVVLYIDESVQMHGKLVGGVRVRRFKAADGTPF